MPPLEHLQQNSFDDFLFKVFKVVVLILIIALTGKVIHSLFSDEHLDLLASGGLTLASLLTFYKFFAKNHFLGKATSNFNNLSDSVQSDIINSFNNDQ